MVTDAQRKLVRKYYLLPKLAPRALATILLLSAEMLFLSMLDDLVFQTSGAFLGGWIAYFVLAVALTVFCCYANLSPRLGMRKPAWATIGRARQEARKQREQAEEAGGDAEAGRMAASAAAVGAAVLGQAAGDLSDAASAAGGITGTARYLEVTSALARDAERAARDLGIELPCAKRAGRTLMLAVLLALALVYGIHFIARVASMRAEGQVAAETVSKIADEFERRGYYVIGDDPTKAYDRDGYTVRALLPDMDDDAYVSLDVDNDGTVFEVGYSFRVDPARSLEENLARAEKYLAELHGVVEGLDVPVAAPGLLSYGTLPDAFRSAFTAGTLYDDIFFNPDDLGSSDGAYIWCSFDTLSEEDWFDGADPAIWLRLETDW